ncbi:MAG: BON domain-containing protein [Arenicellales bacterium]
MGSGTAGDIIKKVKAALERDTRVNLHRSQVTVAVENDGVVTLTGETESIAEKRAAVACASQALAGCATQSVVDRLHVKPVARRENLELKREVESALSGEPVFRDYTLITVVGGRSETVHDAGTDKRMITATIQDGVVTLSGRVGSISHKRLAEVAMWWTDGCRFVDNLLDVVPPEEDTDDDITDVVRMVLEKDPLVHADQISIATTDGVVILLGSVASKEEKKLAIMDAWHVPGVTDIEDRIETRD